jgi:hypothetical protein
LRNAARQQPGRQARHGVGRQPGQSPLPQLVGLGMRDFEPPAAIANLAQIGHRRANQFGHAQTRVIGETDQRRVTQTDDVGAARGQQRLDRYPLGRRLTLLHRLAEPQRRGLLLPFALLAPDTLQRVAHHPGLGGQRFPLAKTEDAVNPRDRGDPAREGGRLCTSAGVRALGQPVQIVDEGFGLGGDCGGDGPPRLAPGEEAFEVGGDRRLGRRAPSPRPQPRAPAGCAARVSTSRAWPPSTSSTEDGNGRSA